MAERINQLSGGKYTHTSEVWEAFTSEVNLLAYDPRFDIWASRQLAMLKTQLPTAEYQRRQNQLDLRTRHNLETCLGERFNVEISRDPYHTPGV